MSGRRAQSVPPHILDQQKPVRGRCVTAICFSWKVITCVVSHVTLVLLVVSYCVGGAYLFQHLEKPHEIEVKRGIHNMRLNLTDKIWKLSDNASVLNEHDWMTDVKRDLANFEKQILTVMKTDGWDGDEDITKSQWTFAGSLFYSIIVITTIGYGHISPRTDWGKVTTIFYAIIGIPLMLLCLSNIGDVMATSFRFIYWRICCYVCTRNRKRSRHRSRQRSVRGHRYPSRSQPPPPSFRRSMRIPQRSWNDSGLEASAGLQHAYSDPELRSGGHSEYERVFENGRADRRLAHGGSGGRRLPQHHRGMPQYEDENIYDNGDHGYTQTLNRGPRFSNRDRQRNRDRMRDRHTIERERYPSRSKQKIDSMQELADLVAPIKRTMSFRSIRMPHFRRDEISRESRESRELNRLHIQHGMPRGRSMPNSAGRGRAKSVDPRLSASYYDDVDEEVIRKTPIISNRYAIDELDYLEHRTKGTPRSQSMPRSVLHKNYYSHPHHHHEGLHDGMQHELTANHRHQPSSSIPNHHHQVSARQLSSHNAHYGNRLELPPLMSPRPKGGHSPHRDIYGERLDDDYLDELDNHVDGNYGRNQSASQARYKERKRKYGRERSERLPPSPRIMSPMGFAVKRQIRRRPSYDYEDDSLYGDGDWSDYLGDISPKDRPVPIWLCVFLVVGYILGGAALFAYWEDWYFLDSAYFCFITLTTIGFGDFVPAKGVKDESEQSIAYCSLYLLFGIALLAMSFNLVQEEFIANVKEVARRLGILKDEEEDD